MFTRNRTLRVIAPIAVSALLTTASGLASGQDFSGGNLIRPGEETFSFTLGGITNQFNTHSSLNGEAQRGTDINLERNGLPKDVSSFEGTGTWRFWSRHRIDADYFTTSRSGDRSYDTTVTIGDNTYPLGATVSAEVKNQFFILDYRYSFMKTDNLELAGLFGFYGSHFEFNFNATAHGSGNTASMSTSASTTVPLPVIGLTADWYVNPRWRVSGLLAGLKATISDVDGRVLLGGVSTDYMFFRNIGVGVRYLYSDLNADITKSNFNGNINWKMNSVSLFARFMF
jgi:hypothetical protein